MIQERLGLIFKMVAILGLLWDYATMLICLGAVPFFLVLVFRYPAHLSLWLFGVGMFSLMFLGIYREMRGRRALT